MRMIPVKRKRKNKAKRNEKQNPWWLFWGFKAAFVGLGSPGTEGTDPPWGGGGGLSQKEPGFPQNGTELQKL